MEDELTKQQLTGESRFRMLQWHSTGQCPPGAPERAFTLPTGQAGSRPLGNAPQPAVIYVALVQLMRFVPGDS